MQRCCTAVKEFLYAEDGPTAVEYGVMIALIAAVVIAGASILGTNTNDMFQSVADVMALLA